MASPNAITTTNATDDEHLRNEDAIAPLRNVAARQPETMVCSNFFNPRLRDSNL